MRGMILKHMELKWHSLLEGTKIVIFGYSRLGKNLCDELLDEGRFKIYFCDNSINKVGQVYKNILVLSVEEAVSALSDGIYVICSLFHVDSMSRQLLELGIEDNKILNAPSNFIEEEMRQMRAEKLHRKQNFQFEVDIAMHCNLKCRSCHHFSPLAKNEITDINIFQQDFERLSALFGESIDRIYLLGGEPLLNENVSAYMEIARKNFSSADIQLVTNGILLPKMTEQFWRCCEMNRIKISVTKYPININYSEIEELCKTKKAEFQFFGSAVDDKHMSYYPLDIGGNQDIQENYFSCNMANNCITLKKGVLYPCVLPPNIVHFNNFYGQCLEVSDKDGINIYEAKSKEEIIDFLSKPIPFCKYCDVKRRTYDNQWKRSEFKIEEWT